MSALRVVLSSVEGGYQLHASRFVKVADASHYIPAKPIGRRMLDTMMSSWSCRAMGLRLVA